MSKLKFNFINTESDNPIELGDLGKCCLGVFTIIFVFALLKALGRF